MMKVMKKHLQCGLSRSPPFTSFADLCILQSYPVVLLPSVFIIGHHGIPLDIIYGSKNVTTNELTMKITRSIELHRSGGTSPLARWRSQCMTPTKPDNTKRIRTSPSLNRNRPQRDQVTHGRRPQQQVVSNPTPPAKTATATTGKVVRRTVEQRPSSTTTNVCRLQLRVFNSDRRLIKQFQPTDTLAVVKECAAESLVCHWILSYWRKVFLLTHTRWRMKLSH
ncbi:UBX domain-containing protein 4-like isoform X6 [Dysidea avara]|uniref:UBX domain-containing protein 4-like isoform X6 n=1 Tax=Dysidea avara TaxID=196820 RepID=UPI00331C50E0